MNNCSPSQASELTDVIINCCTNVLTVIQTAANGEESMMNADLTCLIDKFANVEDMALDCDTNILSITLATSEDCPEERILSVDLTCVDTYVTWTDNGDGTLTLISHDGSETVGVMRDCAGIPHQPVTSTEDQIILCKSDGTTVKGSLEEVVHAGYSICRLDDFIAPIFPDTVIEFGVCVDGVEHKINMEILKDIFGGNMIDGYGTNLLGDGTEANPNQVDLNVCEMPTEVYTENSVMTGCIDGQTRNMPAVKAGDNVTIQADGTLNVYTALPGCDMPSTNYNPNSLLVTCSAGNEITIPAIKPGTNVSINPDGTLNANFPPVASRRTGLMATYMQAPRVIGTYYPPSIVINFQNDPHNFISTSGSWIVFNASGIALCSYQIDGGYGTRGIAVKGYTQTSVAGLPNQNLEYPNAEIVSDGSGRNTHASSVYLRVRAGDRIRFGGITYRYTNMGVGESIIAFFEE